jgi:hypothetical protein
VAARSSRWTESRLSEEVVRPITLAIVPGRRRPRTGTGDSPECKTLGLGYEVVPHTSDLRVGSFETAVGADALSGTRVLYETEMIRL